MARRVPTAIDPATVDERTLDRRIRRLDHELGAWGVAADPPLPVTAGLEAMRVQIARVRRQPPGPARRAAIEQVARGFLGDRHVDAILNPSCAMNGAERPR